MKKFKRIIQIAKHIPTGAKIPVVVKKVDSNNIVQDYHEHMRDRKGFTLQMLQTRWNKCRDDTIELLQEYEVPAFVRNEDVLALGREKADNAFPIDVAIFWEEYIYGIEKKKKLSHVKLKSRMFQIQTEH
jgi:hypothetical protein